MSIVNTQKFKFSVTGDLVDGAATDLSNLTAGGRFSNNLTLNQGAGADSINLQAFGSATIAPSGATTLDLNGGGLLTPSGAAANFTKVRVIVVSLVSGTGPIRVGGANNTMPFGMGSVTNTFDFQSLPFIASRDDSVGFTVTAGSGDKFVVANQGSDTIVLDYAISGES